MRVEVARQNPIFLNGILWNDLRRAGGEQIAVLDAVKQYLGAGGTLSIDRVSNAPIGHTLPSVLTSLHCSHTSAIAGAHVPGQHHEVVWISREAREL